MQENTQVNDMKLYFLKVEKAQNYYVYYYT